ncbi:HNH endonuclease [Carboxylicivirga marina]|uniref:HNH endonuclease n=1 Tax=Carboxylicivirga marina TaxID=2800988 RepID=A0ABS1HQT8_9BACT|nr:HNH endonuclease [Carboxylicivirga marina]MBK3520041.1 HNH endonuclease [Carboxylicivirga marina]
MNWIISANSKMYDHSSAFEHYGFIDWKQGLTKYSTGDIVYIYCTSPIKMIQYKCIIEKTDIDYSQIQDDKKYWNDLSEYEKSQTGKYARLKLIEQVSNNQMRLDNLKQNGLNAAPQGPIKIKNDKLLKYIETYFTDNYQTDYFPEIVGESTVEYEGAKKTVIVNKYERSSKARENAIKHHGLNCKICGLNFKELYGEIGIDFIHIHHLVPIHEIAENYRIDFKKDLIPVCPNCHAMLHRKINGKEPTIDELKLMMNRITLPNNVQK